jgi:predicted acetyltransferase
MRKINLYFFIKIALINSACSTEFYKKTGFEMLQNIHEQQCQQELSAQCPQRESYEEYQRKLKDSQSIKK